ncbi:hypothetical protein HN873_064085, partial [Arachis hypogaea]
FACVCVFLFFPRFARVCVFFAHFTRVFFYHVFVMFVACFARVYVFFFVFFARFTRVYFSLVPHVFVCVFLFIF